VDGYEKILGDQLRNDPTLLASDGLDVVKNIINQKAASPTVFICKTNS
jgi:hypothetical protein